MSTITGNCRPTATAERQLPEHTVEVRAARRCRHVLVIPVVNEGQRLQRQLQAIADLQPAVDVVIADGGSSDGSLNAATLDIAPVRALLTKAGGGLSAQLRMAYAWCLDEGYDGVVTIDGNGKDGVEAIPRFIECLEQGLDLVQGSRYLPGGRHEHTPLSRQVAGRCIHAPLVSLAAGFRYTDTTNGFRAYSRRLLLDARVQPFRDIFCRYNLLFYLSVVAPQLGFRTLEIPVARRYPAQGKIPTKIRGLRGKLAVLSELLAATTGRYHPVATAAASKT